MSVLDSQSSFSEKEEEIFFRKASKFDRTMYGQLALEKLNKKENFIWKKKN